MLNIEDVLARVLQRDEYRQFHPEDFILQTIPNAYSLAALNAGVYGTVAQQAMIFPAGAIIVGMAAGASPIGAASTTPIRDGLNMFTIALQYQQTRSVVGPGQAIATSVFGPFNDLFPDKEIIVPQNGSLLISLTSLVSDALAVWVSAHCLVLNQVQ